MTIRVVLAEDSYLLREGVRRLLEAEPGIELVGVAEDLDGLFEAVSRYDPDVVITDVRMPPDHTDEGIRAAASLRVEHPGIGVVVLSQFAEARFAVTLFEQGSAGRAYLLKEHLAHVDELVAAVRSVATGGSVVDPSIVEALVATQLKSARSPLADLTSREREVLSEMAKGGNNAAIAAALVITERSVETYIHSIFMKLGLSLEVNTNRRVRAVLLFLSNHPA
jgi:DNA-binding NarL/FixJ family response regulator